MHTPLMLPQCWQARESSNGPSRLCMACTAEGIIGGGPCQHCQSIKSSIAALARP